MSCPPSSRKLAFKKSEALFDPRRRSEYKGLVQKKRPDFVYVLRPWMSIHGTQAYFEKCGYALCFARLVMCIVGVIILR